MKGTAPRLGEIGLANYPPYLMNRIMGRYNASLRDEMADLGLTTPKMRALAVLSRERSPLLPDVPTAIEQGLPDFEIMNFMGIFVHKATPPAQIARLEAATRAAVANPAIAQRLREAGTDPVGSSAADFNTFWQAQLALWLPVVEASGVKLE